MSNHIVLVGTNVIVTSQDLQDSLGSRKAKVTAVAPDEFGNNWYMLASPEGKIAACVGRDDFYIEYFTEPEN